MLTLTAHSATSKSAIPPAWHRDKPLRGLEELRREPQLRLASRPPELRRRLTTRAPTANNLGHVRYTDQEKPRRHTDARSRIM